MPTDTDDIIEMKALIKQEMLQVFEQLERECPALFSAIGGTALGAGAGAAGSLAALSSLGSVSGLSAAGVTSGLAAAGALVGGGMIVGLGILATPVAFFGVLGYRLTKKRKAARLAEAVGQATLKLVDIRARLLSNADEFKEELASIQTAFEILAHNRTA
jgi:hypothetical protein